MPSSRPGVASGLPPPLSSSKYGWTSSGLPERSAARSLKLWSAVGAEVESCFEAGDVAGGQLFVHNNSLAVKFLT